MDTKSRVNGYHWGFKAAAFIVMFIGLLAVVFGAFRAKDVALFVATEDYIIHYYYDDYYYGIDAATLLYGESADTLSQTDKNLYEKRLTDAVKKGFNFYVLDEHENVIMSIGGRADKAWDNITSDSTFIRGGWKEKDSDPLIYAVVPNENFNAIKNTLSPSDGRIPFFTALIGLFMFLIGFVWIAVLSGRKQRGGDITVAAPLRIYDDILLAIFTGVAVLFGIGIYGITRYVFENKTIFNDDVLITLSVAGTALFALISFWTAATFGANIKLKRFWRHTLVYKILSSIGKLFKKIWRFFTLPLKQLANKTIKHKLIVTGVILFVVSIINVIIIIEMAQTPNGFAFLWAMLSAGILIAFCVVFIARQVSEIAKIKQGATVIRNGDISHKIAPCKVAQLNTLAEDINNIGEGLQAAVKTATISEKMKTELITNVSHDLKTPLTSIISYIDLLSKEENLSSEAMDYIAVLRTKSERLSTIISDLFDLSKGTSGNIDVQIERLDLKKLILQTIADMDDKVVNSGHIIKQTLPEDEVFIHADGKRLYRVFQNLIDNALKYALPNTRIFTNLSAINGKAVATIQNIAAYEMDFSENEILERFTRGDKSRATDGTGLGLSIAEAFTKLCGGSFGVSIDGDQFKVIVEFDIVP